MACQLVACSKLQIVQISARNSDILLVEYSLQMLQLLICHRVLNHNNRVINITTLNQIHLQKRLQLVQEYERTTWCNLRSVVVEHVERSILITNNLRVVIDVYRHGKLIVWIDDDRYTLIWNCIYLLFGYLIILALGLLLDEACLGNSCYILSCRTIHDWGLRACDVDCGVVHTHSPQSRDDMLDGAHLCCTLLDSCTTRSICYIFTQCRN